ncbi:hypothetical protein PW716_001299 [Salmonella enterica]|nr:hypothetical protein [Salmonella enterica]
MKEPDINAIKKHFSFCDEVRFMGVVLLSPEKGDFLSSCKVKPELFRYLKWTPVPDEALRYDKYHKALNVISRFDLEEKAVVVMFFASEKQFFVCDIPDM